MRLLRLLFICTLMFLEVCVEVKAQDKLPTLCGKVFDRSTTKPLEGVGIYSHDRLIGNSDARGLFIIPYLKDDSLLEFRLQSYRLTSIVVVGKFMSDTLAVGLDRDFVVLEEIVVTGTGSATSKKQLGNAISTISGKEIESGVATSIDQAISGKLSGAQINQNSGNPAGGISVRLRGVSTIQGSSDPLYIIDGVIVNNSSEQLLDLGGYSQNRLVDIAPTDIDHIEIIKGAAAAAIYGSRASNGVVQIFTKKGKKGKDIVTFSEQFRLNELRKKLPYTQYPYRFTNFTSSDTTKVAVTRYDYQDMIFQKAIGNENNVSVSGGSDNTTYLMSASYLANEGIIRSTNFKRTNLRLRIDHQFNSWIKSSLGLMYALSPSHEVPNGGINEAYGALTGFIFSNNYIDPRPDSTGTYPSTAPTNYVTRTNPLEAINRFDFNQKTSRIIGNFQLILTPFRDFSLNYTLGYDNSSQIATGYIPLNNTTPTYTTGYARSANRYDMLVNNDLSLSYRWKPADKVQVNWAAGITGQVEKVNLLINTATDLSPFAQTVSSGGTIVASETRSTVDIFGAYVQGTFGFDNKLFFTAAIRNDASSVFGDNYRWQYYPKVSGTYLVSEEKFWKNSALSEIIPMFKLRASYGQSGNLTAIGAYDRYTNYSSATLSSLSGVVAPTTLGNESIKPERQIEKEIGIDAAFLNNRLGIEISYYQKRVKDLLLNADLAPSSGYSSQYQNIGNLTNKGWEILVRATPVSNSHFEWNTVLTWSLNRNKMSDIPGGIVTFSSGFSAVAAKNGYPLGVFYGAYFARNTDGTILYTSGGLPQRERDGRDETGQPSGTILTKVIGDPNPDWIGSFTNEFTVGSHWSARIQWDIAYGGQLFNFTRRVGERDLYGGLKGYERELKGEVPKGTSAALWSIYENWIDNGSYAKLREISFGYSFKPKFLHGNTLRINAAGRNLLAITNYKGWDPETSAAGQSSAVSGFDFAEVPIPRTFAIGFNLSF